MTIRSVCRIGRIRRLCGLLACMSTAAAAITVDGDPAQYWHQLALSSLPGLPPVTSRGLAMVDVTMFDAVNASLGPTYQGYLGAFGGTVGNERAAIAQAARDVLVHLNPAKTADFDAALAASLALVPDGAAKNAGLATGASAAAAMIARRTGDGAATAVPYTPSGLPGRWAVTTPPNIPAVLPQWGGVTPWLMSSGSQFRPAAPPTLDSAAYTAAFNEVKAIGAAGSVTRDADQTASARFWNAAVGSWTLPALAEVRARGLSTLESARVLAMVATAESDATIAVFDTKYFYDYWRPITAIRAAGADSNPDTEADASWNSLLVAPPHPAFSSGHSGVSGSGSTVLGGLFGDAHDFCITAAAPIGPRCWSSWSEAGEDAANSRLWGGIHWRFDNEAGLQTGRAVGSLALTHAAFQLLPVPEPASWASLSLGVAALLALARRRRAAAKRWFAHSGAASRGGRGLGYQPPSRSLMRVSTAR